VYTNFTSVLNSKIRKKCIQIDPLTCRQIYPYTNFSPPQKTNEILNEIMPLKLGQNLFKYFDRFLGNGVSRKNAFEIY
jgi:hypothetical protein